MKQYVLNIMILYFFALVIFHVSLVYAVFYFLVWPIWLYHIFPYYKRPIFGGGDIERKMWVLIFSPFLIQRRIQQGIIYIYIYIRLHVKYPLLVDFNQSRNLSADFRKRLNCYISLVGPELFVRKNGQTDGWTDLT